MSSNRNIFRAIGHLCREFTGPLDFPTQRPVTRRFDVFFDLRPNKRLSKHWWGWWFETPSRSLWCHCNVCQCSSLDFGFVRLTIGIAFSHTDCVLTHWGRDKIAAISQTTVSNAFSWMKMCESISLEISLKFIPKVRINNIPTLVQIMA